MVIGRIEGATRVLGKSQGYLGLPVRDELVDCPVSGRTPTMVSAWLPSPEEIARIAAGGAVLVRIHGTDHPPIRVDVGPVPEA
jgi:hypothetical protein